MNKVDSGKMPLPWLDAIRFIAAFMVLLSHTRNDYFTEYGQLPQEQQNLFTMLFYFFGKLGHEAVIAFFVLSGFLVGGKLIERVQNNTFDIRTYAIDRTVRIGIPLIAAIFYCGIVSLLTSECSFDGLTALGNLLCMQGIFCEPLVPPFWSLNYEVWFYVLGAAIALIISGYKISGGGGKRDIGFLLFTLSVLIFIPLGSKYLLMWVMGALAYVLPPTKKSRLKLLILPIIIIVLCAVSLTQSKTNTGFVNFYFDRGIVEILLAFTMCTLIRQLLLFQPKGIWIKVNSFFSQMAKFSYTLYLTHMITEYWMFEYFIKRNSGLIDVNSVITWTIFVLVCLLVSFFIYFFTERHTSTVKQYMKRKLLKDQH